MLLFFLYFKSDFYTCVLRVILLYSLVFWLINMNIDLVVLKCRYSCTRFCRAERMISPGCVHQSCRAVYRLSPGCVHGWAVYIASSYFLYLYNWTFCQNISIYNALKLNNPNLDEKKLLFIFFSLTSSMMRRIGWVSQLHAQKAWSDQLEIIISLF